LLSLAPCPHPAPLPVPTRRSSDLDASTSLGQRAATTAAHGNPIAVAERAKERGTRRANRLGRSRNAGRAAVAVQHRLAADTAAEDRKSTRLNSSHVKIPYGGFCLK